MRRLANEIDLAELVALFGGELAGRQPVRIRRLASLASAQADDLSFLSAARHRSAATRTQAGAVVVSRDLLDALPPGVGAIVVENPYAHFARIARWFEARASQRSNRVGIHPTATVSSEAKLGARVFVGAHAVVSADAIIGDDVMIEAQCFIGDGAQIGAGTRLHPAVRVLDDCTLGERCIVHSGTVIGSDGFGFAQDQGHWEKIPQLGAVRIGNDVEIGANCTIDRGALDDTEIDDGCKLDNLIQIAHNVRIGKHSALAGCVGVAGSAVIGSRCMIGGGAGILGHLQICDDVVVSAMSLVTRSIRKPGFYTGVFPMMPNAGWERAAATVRQLPGLRDRVRALEQAMRNAETGSNLGPDEPDSGE